MAKKQVKVDTTYTIVAAHENQPSTSGLQKDDKGTKTKKNRTKRQTDVKKPIGTLATSTPFVRLERLDPSIVERYRSTDDPTYSMIQNDEMSRKQLLPKDNETNRPPMSQTSPIREEPLTPTSKSTPSPSILDNFPEKEFFRECNISRPLNPEQPGPSQSHLDQIKLVGRPTILRDEQSKIHVLVVKPSVSTTSGAPASSSLVGWGPCAAVRKVADRSATN